ncbi:type II secretion system F family protein [Streptomyces sp. NPDC058872]|uniref:type II secretion system F family protein n=1 Tax=Streptomyces sp. NPDC058872 TaxID=3346661 RepID=UPI0036AF4910
MPEVFPTAGLAVLVVALCVRGAVEARSILQARRTRRRAGSLLARQGPSARKVRFLLPPWMGLWAPPLAGAIAGWLLFGVTGGLCAGVLTVGAKRWLAGRAKGQHESVEEEHRLPLAADLLAACVASGAGPAAAAGAVGRSLGGPLGACLARTAAELRLGGEPAEVWRGFAAIPGAEGLARCLERAGSSGAPAAEAIARHATALRAARARSAVARARRAQVLISAPVALCFLPAFLAVGVAPVVIGLMAGLLDG